MSRRNSPPHPDPIHPSAWSRSAATSGQITLAAERAASLTCQPLAFIHPAVVYPQVVELDDAVTDIQEMLRRTLGEHVELVTTLAGDLWPVLADPAQQALLGAIMTGAAGYVSKQTRGADLTSAVRTAASGPSMLDPYASRQVMARLRDRTAGEDPAAALTGQEKRVLELIGQGSSCRYRVHLPRPPPPRARARR